MTVVNGGSPPTDTLYVTDEEMIARLGAPESISGPVIRQLDADPRSGFPRKLALWGGRRYWPAVRAYFDVTNRIQQIGGARSDDRGQVATLNRHPQIIPRKVLPRQ